MSTVALSPLSSANTALLSSLGVSSGNAVATDLQAFTTAQSAGKSSTADAAIVQLRTDLASERTSLLSTLMGSTSSSGTTNSDIGSDLLSSLANLSTSGYAGLSTLTGSDTGIGSQLSVVA